MTLATGLFRTNSFNEARADSPGRWSSSRNEFAREIDNPAELLQ